MRRAILICIMVMLPLQWAWAAAASVCEHEVAATSAHFGHHAHEHQAENAKTGSEPGPSGVDHADCGVCHLWSAQALATGNLQPAPAAEPLRPVAAAPRYDSHVPAGLERPDRIATP